MDNIDRATVASTSLRALPGLAVPSGSWPSAPRLRTAVTASPTLPEVGSGALTCDASGVAGALTVRVVAAMGIDTKFSTRWGRSASPPV